MELTEAAALEPIMKLTLVSRPCPLCGSADDSHVWAEADYDPARWDRFAFSSRKLPEYMHFRLVTCPQCDLLRANPLPTLDSLARMYCDADFDSSEEARYASRTYASILHKFIDKLPDRDGALDIGTGEGSFLEELLAMRFTNVAGVEPSAAPIAAARPEIRPLIRQGLFDAKDYKPGNFSLVTSFQVLEHVYDPLVLCRDALHLLKPGGAAFFICHNRRAVSARILGKKSPIIDIEHLQLFSPRSARCLMEKSGFTDVQVTTVVNRYPLHYWMKLFPLPGRVKRAFLGALRKTGVGRVPIPLPVGNMALVGYNTSPSPQPRP